MIKTIHKVSKFLLLGFVLISTITSLLLLKSPATVQNFPFMIGSTLVFVVLVWIDMLRVLGIKKMIWFIALTMTISYLSEFFGVNFGQFFGGAYGYNPAMGLSLGGVPLVVIAMWTAVVYICYRIAVIISGKREKFNPSAGSGQETNYEKAVDYFLIALVAGLMAVSWDLVWDPLAVKIQSWVWQGSSSYFGIPLQNFTGWIIVVFLSCLIFEFTTKNNKNETKDIVIPFLGYFYLLASTFILALRLNEPHFALLSFIIMSPYLLIVALLKLKKGEVLFKKIKRKNR